MTIYANEIPATVYAAAHAQGVKAGNACSPTPMIVGTPTTPLGNDIDYEKDVHYVSDCLLYTSPSPRDTRESRMPSSA